MTMRERTRQRIKQGFVIVWLLTLLLLIYKAAVTPIHIKFDLSFILELLDATPLAGDGTLDNFVL